MMILLFNISSPLPYWTRENSNGGYFCIKEPIIGGPPNVVVDGLLTTAWTTIDQQSPSNKYIDFDFGNKKVFVSSIAIQTLCNTPKHMIFEGSNDNGNKWFTIVDKEEVIPEYKVTNIECTFANSYSLFRIRQIGQNTNPITQYRFHVQNVEFYGKILNFLQNFTCMKRFSISLCHLTFLFIIS